MVGNDLDFAEFSNWPQLEISDSRIEDNWDSFWHKCTRWLPLVAFWVDMMQASVTWSDIQKSFINQIKYMYVNIISVVLHIFMFSHSRRGTWGYVKENRQWVLIHDVCEMCAILDREWGSGSRIRWMTPAKGVVGRLEVGRLEVGRRDSSVSLFATSPTFSSSFFSTPDPEGDRRDSTVAWLSKMENSIVWLGFPLLPLHISSEPSWFEKTKQLEGIEHHQLQKSARVPHLQQPKAKECQTWKR